MIVSTTASYVNICCKYMKEGEGGREGRDHNSSTGQENMHMSCSGGVSSDQEQRLAADVFTVVSNVVTHASASVKHNSP